METFESFWVSFRSKLKGGTVVRNWTAFGGYLGDAMTVADVGGGSVCVDAPRAMTTQVIQRSDFEEMWKVWRAYKAQTTKRHELRDMTRYSKYIISILHWMEEEQDDRS